MLTARPVPGLARLLSLLTTVVLGFGVLAVGAGTANAATGYKYWNYFHVQNGAYVFAKTGPSGYTPKDGSVEAYRYGLSTVSSGLKPRTGATTYPFAKICAGADAHAGQKRVGVLIDYGTKAEAARGETPPSPRAACAVVPTDATGQQVLDSVADVRVQKQLVCGIDGYPASTCSVTVKDAPKSGSAGQNVSFTLPKSSGKSSGTSAGTSSGHVNASADDGRGAPWVLIGAIVIVVLVLGAAIVLSRRRTTR
jgi:hypothetical protein